MSSFYDRLLKASQMNRSLLCVGLDPDPSLIPLSSIVAFNRAIIDATKDLVCSYKPNLAFYDSLGKLGYDVLAKTLEHIPAKIPVIGDAKKGDVQSTSIFHARTMFEIWNFDAATVNPYGGRDAIQPFLDYHDRGTFVWCRSSNPGAKEIQDLNVRPPDRTDLLPFYEWIALRSSAWNVSKNVGLVVGATYPDELRNVRNLCPDMPILIPGIGAQSGDLGASVKNGVDGTGRNAIFSVSRSIIYASKDPKDFEKAANGAAQVLRDRINTDLAAQGKDWTNSTL